MILIQMIHTKISLQLYLHLYKGHTHNYLELYTRYYDVINVMAAAITLNLSVCIMCFDVLNRTFLMWYLLFLSKKIFPCSV